MNEDLDRQLKHIRFGLATLHQAMIVMHGFYGWSFFKQKRATLDQADVAILVFLACSAMFHLVIHFALRSTWKMEKEWNDLVERGHSIIRRQQDIIDEVSSGKGQVRSDGRPGAPGQMH